MKDVIQQYLHTLKKYLPGTGGSAGAGQHVKRDWFSVLTITVVVLMVLGVVDVYRALRSFSEDTGPQGTQNTFTLPMDEVKLQKVLQAYRTTTAAFEEERAKLPEPDTTVGSDDEKEVKKEEYAQGTDISEVSLVE